MVDKTKTRLRSGYIVHISRPRQERHLTSLHWPSNSRLRDRNLRGKKQSNFWLFAQFLGLFDTETRVLSNPVTFGSYNMFFYNVVYIKSREKNSRKWTAVTVCVRVFGKKVQWTAGWLGVVWECLEIQLNTTSSSSYLLLPSGQIHF